jgi:glutathione peroxidase-family protein
LTKANYAQLTQLHDEYHERGLYVLAFPCNQFAGQEPGNAQEILQFASQYNGADKKWIFFEKGKFHVMNES